ncbi:MAG: TRAP transporter small permease subunit [Pseudomonadota bacterium]
MDKIIAGIDTLNAAIGKAVAWAALALSLWQFGLIIAQSVFRASSIFAQESLIYMNALMFLGAGAFTLLRDEHVRVDLFYHRMSTRAKAWVNLLGTVLLLWPLCVLILYAGTPYVAASWALREGSIETSGIQAVYLLKTLILMFGVMMTLQGVSLFWRSLKTLRSNRADG